MGKDSPIAQYLRKASGWFHGLSSRDQLALKVMLVALGFFALFFLVWKPAVEFRDRSRDLAEQRYSDLVWMVQNEAQARGLSRQGGSGGQGSLPQGQSLLTVISTTARGQGITLQRFEPRGDEKINVWLEKVEFNKLMNWLEMLNKQFGIDVEQISVDRGNEAGRVQARLSLTV